MTDYKGYRIEIEHVPNGNYFFYHVTKNGEAVASYLNSKHQAKCLITRLIKKEKQD